MREFKRFDGDIDDFVPSPVAGFEFQPEMDRPVPEFGVGLGERIGVDLLQKQVIEQTLLLLPDRLKLLLHFSGPLDLHLLVPVSHRPQPVPELLPELVALDPELVEEAEDLLIKFSLGHADAGVVATMVLGTAIVDVFPLALLGLLPLRLARDRAAAVTTLDQFGPVGQPMGLVDLLAEEELNPIPCGPIHERLVDSGIPLATVLHFPDVRSAGQNVVELAATEPRLRWAELDALIGQGFDQCVEGVIVVSVKLVDSP